MVYSYGEDGRVRGEEGREGEDSGHIGVETISEVKCHGAAHRETPHDDLRPFSLLFKPDHFGQLVTHLVDGANVLRKVGTVAESVVPHGSVLNRT